ncbi:hypothetical protein E2C01_017475 [Portunus trituberculatus]|uniref:Uncharacterized protein n=1 Tax=Portunus trituberculatus TaxID=210409 RepID=A0A5B7DTK4_PORTR|nr:hypothetical protein [Portunus trituberculatus]
MRGRISTEPTFIVIDTERLDAKRSKVIEMEARRRNDHVPATTGRIKGIMETRTPHEETYQIASVHGKSGHQGHQLTTSRQLYLLSAREANSHAHPLPAMPDL